LPRHEHAKTMLGDMVRIMAMERDMDVHALGSTTFRRQMLEKGLEPDECFYVQNHAKVWNKDDLDLDIDPPPDLVIEVEVTRRVIARLPIYAALGVPELWRQEGLKVVGLSLVEGKYEPIETSLAFPFLKPAELQRFLNRWPTIPQTAVLREFRDWVRQGLGE